MEPLMSFEGYQVIENLTQSNNLLNNFYQQMGYTIQGNPKETIITPPASTNPEAELKPEVKK
ncbi:hypothetical protein HH214_08875 [Mucilaginibacter robiniae]|uniref:Uncharacterized protein n=1 Tax=Mucilaginibacter robiniae TaxID=2728022 RepID=A0A7L5DXZ4_9SPHI|nr:hypothetical protein [Mucilaginibacter robiniae]QJD95982.1 hypothetical protein HH214_08875 [Mucilaginibacter robiniae]